MLLKLKICINYLKFCTLNFNELVLFDLYQSLYIPIYRQLFFYRTEASSWHCWCYVHGDRNIGSRIVFFSSRLVFDQLSEYIPRSASVSPCPPIYMPIQTCPRYVIITHSVFLCVWLIFKENHIETHRHKDAYTSAIRTWAKPLTNRKFSNSDAIFFRQTNALFEPNLSRRYFADYKGFLGSHWDELVWGFDVFFPSWTSSPVKWLLVVCCWNFLLYGPFIS